MSLLQILNILLFFTHIAALLTCASVVFYFLSVWISGRHHSTALFPFPEVELASKILGAALFSLWLTTLPAVLVESLLPDRYFSITGVVLLGILTLVASLGLYLIMRLQDRVTRQRNRWTRTGLHRGFRILAAALFALLSTLMLLLVPRGILPPVYSVLHPNDILPEVFMIFGLFFGLFLATTTVLRDKWLNRREANR